MAQRAGVFGLLAIAGASVVLGMLVGSRSEAPARASTAASSELTLPVAAEGEGTQLCNDFADVAERALPAVVAVTTTQLRGGAEGEGFEHPLLDDPQFRRYFEERERDQDGPELGQGSGFAISPDGHVLTNYHVIEGADRIQVARHDGTTFDAKVVGTDPPIDLALLKVDTRGERFTALPLGNSDGLRIGEWVVAIGNPHDFHQTVTVGVISGKGRRVPIGTTDSSVVSFIQTDAAINFGNSGGPLLDGRGNVVGINTAIRRAQLAEGIGFALPINQVRKVLEDLHQHGRVRRGFIGITMNQGDLDSDSREYYGLPDPRGVIVSEVHGDGPAARAGVRREDVIRRVNGEIVEDNLDLIAKIANQKPGDSVRLEVFRGGRPVELTAVLEDRPTNGVDESEPEYEQQGGVEESTGLGITVETLGAPARERLLLADERQGVLVTAVDFASTAYDKGIEPDVVVTAINGTELRSAGDWARVLGDLEPGRLVKLDVWTPTPQGEQLRYVVLRTPPR
jgi:serine protease Do